MGSYKLSIDKVWVKRKTPDSRSSWKNWKSREAEGNRFTLFEVLRYWGEEQLIYLLHRIFFTYWQYDEKNGITWFTRIWRWKSAPDHIPHEWWNDGVLA